MSSPTCSSTRRRPSTRRCGSTSASRTRPSSAARASSSRSTTRCPRSSTGTSRRARSSRAAPAPASTSAGSAARARRSPGAGRPRGPVSFMRGADASAGTIKSGGKTRRAAKMVILNIDHPDVHDFVWCKAREEQKARALRDAGFDMDLDGQDAYSIQYQNANNSVRVTDEFMKAYEQDQDWKLKAVTVGRDGRDDPRARADARDGPGRVGVRGPRHAVRHHDQRVAHVSGHGPDQRQQSLLRVHAPGQQRVQPRLAEPDEVHGRRRRLRRQGVPQGRRCRVHGPGDPGRQLRLPHREDRRERARVPPAGSRLRQPRRPPDGSGAAVRLGRGAGVGGGDHRADDRPGLPDERPDRRGDGSVRGLRAQRRRDAPRDAQAP